jgi:predicted PP-loop superfamily ATPase
LEIKKKDLIIQIENIRAEIGHESAEVNIKEVFFDSEKGEMVIITPDRPDKSAVIGKGGWVVGRLKETLGVNKIHVESFTDVIVRQYRMELALKKIKTLLSEEKFSNPQPVMEIQNLLSEKINKISHFDFFEYFNQNGLNDISDLKSTNIESDNYGAVVALSGGVDSSFSLIMANWLGFNPIAVTVDPGSIILPRHFKDNINTLVNELGVKHEYIDLDFTDFVNESFEGRFHPCGRCSKKIHGAVMEYAKKNNINTVIFGDLISTGGQSVIYKEKIIRINLPALLGVSKQELQKVTTVYGVKKSSSFGCPLLGEVQKKFPHMRRYSIQRVLRETRAGVLEPGEALDLIWSSCKDLK